MRVPVQRVCAVLTLSQDLAKSEESDAEISAAFKHDDSRFLNELTKATQANKREKLKIRARCVEGRFSNA